MSTDVPLPPTSPANDPRDYPMFKGGLSRWAWRIYFQRLTTSGRWFALISMGFVSYSGASLQLQGYVAGAYAAAVWGVAWVAMLFARPKVTAVVRSAERVCAGELLAFNVELTNTSPRRQGELIVLPHRLPRSMTAQPPAGVTLADLPPSSDPETHGLAIVAMSVRCAERGRFEIAGARIESAFPFGILRSRRTVNQPTRVLVYPRFSPLARLEIPTGRRYQPGGVALASELGESFEYLGNREYREGDNVRDIDWRATARLGSMANPVVREWVEEYMLRVAVVLDTHVPLVGPNFSRRDITTRRAALERAVSVSAAVSDYMARQDYLVDLFAAGPDLYHLTAGRSLASLDEILDILACVRESREPPFSVVVPAIGDMVERLSTVVFVALDFDDARRAFVEELRQKGVAVKLIVVRDGPCSLDPALLGDAVHVSLVTTEAYERGVDTL